ncbi:MAG TPA: RHS repeat-associated core domain-containing protein, partial [Fimbriimonadaceae bacterium]|nr:RHS repeat-associated core domain-containing protein [Fimbriimonadaceae bacterium]
FVVDGQSLGTGGNASERQFSYDLRGELVKAALDGNDAAAVTRVYDSLGRLTAEANNAQSISFRQRYLPGSRATDFLRNNSVLATTTLTHDELYRPAVLNLAAGNQKLDLARFSYASGSLDSTTYGSGAIAHLSYDDLGRWTGIDLTANQAPIASLHDNLGVDGVPRERRRAFGQFSTIDYFEVDLAGRLIVENLAQPDNGFHGSNPANSTVDAIVDKNARYREYALDDVANWSARTGTDSLVIDPPDAANRYPKVDGQTVNYDGAGDFASWSSTSATFNGLGQLVQAKSGDKTLSFRYDALGRRVKESDGQASTIFVWQGSSVAALGPDDGNTDHLRLIAGLDSPIAIVDQLGAGTVRYQHASADGSTFAATDQIGKLVEGYVYSAYGEPSFTDSGGHPLSASAIDNRFLYQGQLYDPPLGLYSFRAREYQSAWGRFLSPDPIGLGGGPNLYAFVNAQPLTFTDRFGLNPNAGQTGFNLESIHWEPTRFESDYLANQRRVLDSRYDFETRFRSWQSAVLQSPLANLSLLGSGIINLPYNLLSASDRFAYNLAVYDQTKSLAAADRTAGAAAEIVLGSAALGSGLGAVDDTTTAALTTGLSDSAIVGRTTSGFGDLSAAEIEQIQAAVDEAGRPLEVVGSAARGERTAASDIDYVVPPSSLPYYEGLQGRLPSMDPTHGIIPGVANRFLGPAIRFEPGAAPIFIPKAAP